MSPGEQRHRGVAAGADDLLAGACVRARICTVIDIFGCCFLLGVLVKTEFVFSGFGFNFDSCLACRVFYMR